MKIIIAKDLEITIWCSCGDKMELKPDDKFQETYGTAYECFGCQKTIYLDIKEKTP